MLIGRCDPAAESTQEPVHDASDYQPLPPSRAPEEGEQGDGADAHDQIGEQPGERTLHIEAKVDPVADSIVEPPRGRPITIRQDLPEGLRPTNGVVDERER